MGLKVLGKNVIAAGPRDWWDVQWPFVTGCTKVSLGCMHCTAEELTARAGSPQATLVDGRPRWTGAVTLHADRLENAARWSRPVTAFVCPMSDFFHRAIPENFRERAYELMVEHPEHTFVIVTKRSSSMLRWARARQLPTNVWLVVSVENQAVVSRVYDLLDTGAAVRGVSCEPLLGDIRLAHLLGDELVNWVIAGPELGMAARPCDPDWMRRLRDDAGSAGVPFFTKHVLDDQIHRGIPDRIV